MGKKILVVGGGLGLGYIIAKLVGLSIIWMG